MTLQVRFVPAALDELHAADDWYEQQTPGVGAEFVAEVWQVIERTAEWPALASRVAVPVRRARFAVPPCGASRTGWFTLFSMTCFGSWLWRTVAGAPGTGTSA